ncbi:MAG: tetratricopeptide repeat protein [Myxococcales bacterium]|nr:tetratricopeptide repeat protein [Myxococcales bacterium]
MALLLGVLAGGAPARPARAAGFEPWLQAELLYEQIDELRQHPASPLEVEKAEMQLHWCQTALGEGHPSTALAMAQLGLLLFHGGEIDRAEPLLQASRDRLRHIPREREGRTMWRVLLALGATAELRGRADEAMRLGEEALAVRRRLPGTVRPGPQEVALALLYLRAGARAQAEASLRTLVQADPLTSTADLRRSAALHELWALSLWELGRHEEAEATQQAVIQGLERAAGASTDGGQRKILLADLSSALNNQARWLQRRGRIQEAEALLQRALQLRIRLYGERDPRTLMVQRNLASLLWLDGQTARAEASLVSTGQAAADPAQLLLLGALYADTAPSSPRAAAALRRAAAASGEIALQSQERLARLLLQQGHTAEAVPLATRVLEARTGALPKTHPALLRASALAASAALLSGQRQQAEQLIRQALQGAVGPSAPPPQSPLLALLRAQLAALLLDRPDPSTAAPAAGITRTPRLLEGAQLLAQALEATAAFAHQVAATGAPAWFAPTVRLGIAGLAGLLLPAMTDGASVLTADLATSLLRVVDALPLGDDLAAELSALAHREGEAANHLQQLWRQRAALLLFSRFAQPEFGPAPTVQELTPLETAIQTAEQQLARRSPSLQQLLGRRALDVAQLERIMARRLGSTVVFFRVYGSPYGMLPTARRSGARSAQGMPPLRGPSPMSPTPLVEPRERYAALVVRPAEPPHFIDLGESAPIDATVERLSKLVDGQRDIRAELQQLGQQLVEPLLPYLPATGRLYVVAPPELLGIPFGALIVGGSLLCSRGPVQVFPRLADLLEAPPPPPPQVPAEPLQRLLLLGAPLLREPLPYLPRTYPPPIGHGEMAEVNHLLRQHRYDPRGGPITGVAATKSRLRAWLPSHIVHVLAPLVVLPDAHSTAAQARIPYQAAAHSLAFPLVELGPPRPALPPSGLPAVALAASSPRGTSGDADDGLLLPEEMARLDLRRTALLVLSGPVLQPTDRGALVRLEQAAMRAGAAQVVLTLWRPPEAAARQVMGQLYRGWLRTGDAAEAVRELQLALHARGHPPLHWAGLRATSRR